MCVSGIIETVQKQEKCSETEAGKEKPTLYEEGHPPETWNYTRLYHSKTNRLMETQPYAIRAEDDYMCIK
ncbi:uncharacterized protein RAG0_01365 [Rhynchosporium agropyri]|uniref:Uncharacterized protein n=1 Tax=Rhynchosporium agropyri TaxID=914238 RepID=A0A1E1JWE2_9HELO|nr:uncharacterized protein RAG0_01365 [Rhynchosporium agropyri]